MEQFSLQAIGLKLAGTTVAGLIAVSATLLTSAEAKAQDLQPLEIMTGTMSNAVNWGIAAALEKGFFEEYGFDAQHQTNSSGSTAVAAQMLAAQRIHLVTTNIDPLIAAMTQGSDKVRVLGASTRVPDWVLVASPDIASVEDVKGKRIGFSSLVANDRLFVSQYLNEHGVGDDEWEAIQAGRTPEKLAAIENGSTVAGLLGEPSATVAAQGGFNVMARMSDLGPVPATIYAVSADWAAENDNGIRVRDALVATHAWLADPANKQEATAIMIANSRIDQAVADEVWDHYFGDEGIFSMDLAVDEASLNEHIDLLLEFGGIEKDIEAEAILLDPAIGGSRQ